MRLRRLRVPAAWLAVPAFVVVARPTVATLLVGVPLAAVGLGVRAWAAGTIDKNRALTTDGPYGLVRNPLYAGSFLLGLGVSFTGGGWVWPTLFALGFAVLYAGQIAHEERRLLDLFGDAYRDYAARVPALLPAPWPRRRRGRPAAPLAPPGAGPHAARPTFNWARYRHNREWQAALGAVAVFAALAAKVVLSG